MKINLTLRVDSPEIRATLEAIMSKLDDLAAAVAAESTVIDSAITLINGMNAQLQELQKELADAGIYTTKIQALIDKTTTKTQALADSVAANTPAPAPAPAVTHTAPDGTVTTT